MRKLSIVWQRRNEGVIKMLSRLNEQQKEAVLHKEGPMLILAGAGSGKTGVITTRIAYLIKNGVEPYNILAVTFTNKAAREMRERVGGLLGKTPKNIVISTFHSFCMRVLKLEIEKLGYKKNFTLYTKSDQVSLMRSILKEIRVDVNKFDEGLFLSIIDGWKNAFLQPWQITPKDNLEEFAVKAYELYIKYLKGYNALDFNDLINLSIELYTKFPETLEKYQNRFKYIMVDEYQDTNAAQYRLISLLAAKEKNLVVVGDDDQSIYAFRGADITNILSFEEDYPNAKVIRLEKNYRSTEAILNVANAIISNNNDRREKTLQSQLGSGIKPQIVPMDDDRAEAVFVADEIFAKCAAKNAKWKDFCILYRVNAQSRPFEEELRVRNVPYTVVGGFEFYERKEIKDVMAYLNLFVNPSDEISLLRIINFPKRGIGSGSVAKLTGRAIEKGEMLYEMLFRAHEIDGIPQKALDGIRELVALIQKYKEIFDDKENKNLSAFVEKMLDEIDHTTEILNSSDNKDKAAKKLENVASLLRGIEEYQKSVKNPSIKGFLDTVALMKKDDKEEDDKNSVTLLSIHSAKGLEFPYVYLVGMEDGYLPHIRSMEDDAGIEEERRLCYVAVTRAKKELIMTLALKRRRRGQDVETQPSRFLSEIPEDQVLSGVELEAVKKEEEQQGYEYFLKVLEKLNE